MHKYKIETKKDKVKIVRFILEWIVLIVLLIVGIQKLTTNNIYKAYNPNDHTVVSGKDNGFVVLSYFGVNQEQTNTLISTKQLDEQLGLMHQLGYVTITQQDILNYYQKKIPLPDKALFLMFEDGRRDTALFANKILEKYNYKATILSYADKFAKKDPKFLSEKDLNDLQKSGYWEIGTNGYRLSYINSYDRYERFLGQMTSDEFVAVNQYLSRNYNHYLMDYIRDKDGVSTESDEKMESRITRDYNYMEYIYNKGLGFVPKLYCLMHSNTGRFGNNEKVSKVNEENIKELFEMNFNRDGLAYNSRNSSIYDLTRIQPQPYWNTNHLLMRIINDLPDKQKNNIVFYSGKEKYATKGKSNWNLKSGAVQYEKNSIILTSLAKGEGILDFIKSSVKNTDVETELTGNKIGSQTIYLRADNKLTNCISVSLNNNYLVICEKKDGLKSTLFEMNLHDLVPKNQCISEEEDMRDSLAAEYHMRGRFVKSTSDSLIFYKAENKVKQTKVHTVLQGANEYIPEIESSTQGNTKLKITLQGTSMHVLVNDKDVTGEIKVSVTNKGKIALGSQWGGFGYSQRNVADDVYDGIFKNLVIKNGNNVLYDNQLHGISKIVDIVQNVWNKVLNWFIENM